MSEASSTPGAADEYRLPTNVKPTHYDLIIRTDLDKLQFEGFVKISLDVKDETAVVCLHVSTLKLGKASIYSHALMTEQVQSGESLDKALERVTYHFSQALPGGSKAELRMGFSGEITENNMTGYYKSSWTDEQGEEKFFALTHFQPTMARGAFPCWDEPSLKATFSVTMISRDGTVNLGNMPAISEEVYDPEDKASEENTELTKLLSPTAMDGEKWKITRFQTTPSMSTYIVAYANGYFKYLEKSVVMPLSGKNIPLRIYGTADVIDQAQFALDVTAAVLPLYEQIFDVEYPLPKLDTLVANDLDRGAMENWGLITGRTGVLLVDPKSTGLFAKKVAASVQSHAVAHMWFGNITTMEWWDYVYLNEGFASLMGEVIMTVFPEWKMNSEFITKHLNRTLDLDAKLSAHPIEVACRNESHIDRMFDTLSFSKTTSVLRMLSNHVGENLFLKGVSLYLKKNLYANAVTGDFWEGISTETGINIVQLTDNWISKTGFPVLTVTETTNSIRVRQDRFLETGLAEPKDNETIWNVPLSILTVDQDGKAVVNRSAILEAREQTFELDTSRPYKLNAGTIGVYRVLYTPERFAKIVAEAAKPEGTSAFLLEDRIGLVHDAMALSKAGLANMSSVLTLVDALKGETDYLVWSAISDNLSDLLSIWWEDPILFDRLNAFRRALFVPIVNKLGYDPLDNESRNASLLRTCAIGQAALARDAGVMQEFKDRFAHFMNTGDDSKIPADLQRQVFSTAVRLGGKKEYDAVVRIQEKSKTPSAKYAAIHAMCATEDPELSKQTLDFIIHKSKEQDIVYFFLGLTSNLKTRRLLFQFFKDNYDTFYKLEENFTYQYLIEMTLMGLSTEKDHSDIVEFFKDKNTFKYDQTLTQVLDSIRAKVMYIKRSSEDMAEWFEARPYS